MSAASAVLETGNSVGAFPRAGRDKQQSFIEDTGSGAGTSSCVRRDINPCVTGLSESTQEERDFLTTGPARGSLALIFFGDVPVARPFAAPSCVCWSIKGSVDRH